MNSHTIKLLSSKEWRLNHLYKIENKQGNLVRFNMNIAQRQFFIDRMQIDSEYIAKDIILKARQLGMTTFCLVDFFDDVLFSKGMNARFIAQGEREMKESFRKIKVLWETLEIKPHLLAMGLKVTEETTTSLAFNTGSSISITLSGRGGTFQRLHISELAKIQTLSQIKAEEIKTGSLNTVPLGGRIVIESTAEGMSGLFYEYWQKANEHKDKENYFYKPHFYPWYFDTAYKINNQYIEFNQTDRELQSQIKIKNNYDLSDNQLAWYKLKREEQGDKMVQEYPTYPTEAFLSSGRLFYNVSMLQNIQHPTYHLDAKYSTLKWYTSKTEDTTQLDLLYGVDVAEGLDSGDYSTIRVRTRQGRIIASYRDHIEPDRLPEVIDHIRNTLRCENDLIGIEANNHGNTVISKSKDYDWYYNIFVSKDIDKISNTPKNKRGWQTTAVSRPMMLDEHEEAIRKGLIDIDEDLLQEIYSFVVINAKPQANNGSHDDLIMADAIAYQMRKYNQRREIRW